MPKASAQPKPREIRAAKAAAKQAAPVAADSATKDSSRSVKTMLDDAMLGAPPGFAWVTHGDIAADPHNARKSFDEDGLKELANSMARKGLLQKPAIRLATSGERAFQLVAGERRWRAWGMLIDAGAWEHDRRELCPVISATDAEAEEAGLMENLQRKDLPALEEAAGFKRLIEVHGHTTATIAEQVGFTQRFVQQRLQLLELKPQDRVLLEKGQLTIEDARRRIANYPKPVEFTAEQQVLFLEVADRVARQKGATYWTKVLIHYDGLTDERLKGLANYLNAVTDWQSKQAMIGLHYSGRTPLEQYTGADEPNADKIAPALREARLALLADTPDAVAQVDALEAGKTYLTPWLNKPFTIDPAKLKELEVEKARDAQREAARAADLERRRKLEAESKAATVEVLAFVPRFGEVENSGGELAELLQRFDAPLPWKWVEDDVDDDNAGLFDANGNMVSLDHWDAAGLLPLVMAAVNAAAGHPPVFENRTLPLDRPGFLAAIADYLQEDHESDRPTAEARAERVLANYLTSEKREFGDEAGRWHRAAAHGVAQDFDVEDPPEDETSAAFNQEAATPEPALT